MVKIRITEPTCGDTWWNDHVGYTGFVDQNPNDPINYFFVPEENKELYEAVKKARPDIFLPRLLERLEQPGMLYIQDQYFEPII